MIERVDNWIGYTFLAVLLLIFLFTSPFFNFQYADTTSWAIIEKQASDLLAPVQASPGSHDAKKMFRLTVPLLANFFQLNRVGIIVLQMAAGLAIIYLFICLAYRALESRTLTFLASLLAASCYFMFSAFYDVFGRVDSFGYFFLLLAMWKRQPMLIFLAVLLASFCDERALVGSTFVLVYWLMAEQDGKLLLKHVGNKPLSALSVILAWIAYGTIRYGLTHYFGFRTHQEGVGLAILFESRHHIPIAVFSTFGLAWWIIISAFAVLIYQRQWLLFGVLIVCFSGSLCASLIVKDINRSLAYCFPILLISLQLLRLYIPYIYIYSIGYINNFFLYCSNIHLRRRISLPTQHTDSAYRTV